MASKPKPSQGPTNGHREFELYDELMPVRRYKLLLQAFMKRRGSGTRQAIAEALGNTRSFVTQITSPAYDVAIPGHHVRTIMRLAALAPDEERAFLDAYVQAHPDRRAEVMGRGATGHSTRTLNIILPVLADPRAQQRLETLVESFARDVAAAMMLNELEAAPAKDKTAA